MLKIATAAEQVAPHLKQGIVQERWSKTMPGRNLPAKEVGLDGSIIERALQPLEEQGVAGLEGNRFSVKAPERAGRPG